MKQALKEINEEFIRRLGHLIGMTLVEMQLVVFRAFPAALCLMLFARWWGLRYGYWSCWDLAVIIQFAWFFLRPNK